jgi:putative phosphoesterase
MTIGLLSDTHGFLDERVFDHFSDCDQVWHAGDVGNTQILERLAAFKPLKAIYGNIDGSDVRSHCPGEMRFSCEELTVWMTHIGGYPPRYKPEILKGFKTYQPHIFVCGHTHILRVMTDPKLNHLLYLNPGAVGHHGFHSVRTMLKFEINVSRVSNVRVIELGRRGVMSAAAGR